MPDSSSNLSRIFLSAPDIGELERQFVEEAFVTNWIAPLGPHVDAFEDEFSAFTGMRAACALSSGTAGLHLALLLAGVEAGDEVLCSTFSFVASANPITYLGARPVFVDSEWSSWNLDPGVLEDVLKRKAAAGKVPRALMLVHIYGQSSDIDPILATCARYGVVVVEDAAESLGATYRGKYAGTFGQIGVFSFNGNKIITTSGGGMLVSNDRKLIERGRFLATQARDPGTYYQHSFTGYNYRLSNVSAAIGRGQMRMLPLKIEARRRIFERYRAALGDMPGITFMPEATFGRSTRWLTCILVDEAKLGVSRAEIVRAMEECNIETRPVWRPLHRQPLFAGSEVHGGEVSEMIGQRGLSLPSSSNLSDADQERVITAFRRIAGGGTRA